MQMCSVICVINKKFDTQALTQSLRMMGHRGLELIAEVSKNF
jgi:hypothetical protein